MEIFLNTKSDEEYFFETLDSSSPKILESIIQNEIILQMKIRRKNLSERSADELMEKLYRSKYEDKEGEKWELEEVLFADINGCIGITAKLAGELADHGYYRLQQNIPEEESLMNWYNNEAIGFRGIPYESILIFTIIKYATRINYGDDKNYKDIEHSTLQRFLDTKPELTNLWLVKYNEENSSLFKLIEEINS